jgi:hypothetical protein
MKYFKNKTELKILKKIYKDNVETLNAHIVLREKGLNYIDKIDFPKGENLITKLKKEINSEGYEKFDLVFFYLDSLMSIKYYDEEDLDKYIDQLEKRFRNIQKYHNPFLSEEVKLSKERELNLNTYSLCVSDYEFEKLDEYKGMCENEELPLLFYEKEIMNERILNNDTYGMPLSDSEFDDYKNNQHGEKLPYRFGEITNNVKEFGFFGYNLQFEETRLRIKNFDESGIPETDDEKKSRQECARNLETDGFALDDFTFDYTDELEDNLSKYGLYLDTKLINHICKKY